MRYFKRGRYKYLLVLALCSLCMWTLLSLNKESSNKDIIPALDHEIADDGKREDEVFKVEDLRNIKPVGTRPTDELTADAKMIETRVTKDIAADISRTISIPSVERFLQKSIHQTANISKAPKDEVVWRDAILLAGNTSRQGLLTIGIPSVMRPNASYLQTTLKSLINNMSVKERQQVVCVIFLSGDNATFAAQLARSLTITFPKYLQNGFIRLITAPSDYYPSLDTLKRTYNDKADRVKWRSKQNLDYAFLIHYSRNISKYYLQIEDDVLAAQDFFGKIQLFIKKQTKEWAMLDFSGKGFIGKLFKSADLPKLAHLLRVFFNEQPCDFLINYFSSLLIQPKAIVRKPAIFKHIGYYSSLKDQIRKVEESTFTNNPDATLNTTIETYKKYYLSNVYHSNTKFWGKTPHAGDRIDIMFEHIQNNTKKIIIQTGEPKKTTQDRIKGAMLEAGRGPVNSSGVGCASYVFLGKFVDGDISYNNNGIKNIRCLRITITQDQESWLVIRKIKIVK